MRVYFLLTSLLFVSNIFCQVNIDSAKLIAKTPKSETDYIATCFFIGDSYMDLDQYDSAQQWLNKIHELLPIKTVSVENYLLLARQSEVYYYSNLHQLGLQESLRCLSIAEALNDSVYLANSYNFIGLFYANIDSLRPSIASYSKGLLCTSQPPNIPKYFGMSKSYHLHGNIAEAYFKLGKLDSAIIHYQFSLLKAKKIPWPRAIALAYNGLGESFYSRQNIDSAFYYYRLGKVTAQQSNQTDVILVSNAGEANCHLAAGNSAVACKVLDSSFQMIKNNPNINRLYLLMFLKTAIAIYEKNNDKEDLLYAMQEKSRIDQEIISGNNTQLQSVLNASIQNEKRVLSLQVDEAKQKQKLANIRLLFSLASIVLLIASFLIYRYYQNQKLAFSKLRHKISQDLHDDIGASLSSLQIYGAIAEKSMAANPVKVTEMLQKINVQSREILENMSDIVWSMKSNSTGGTSLETKIKNYAAGLLADCNIHFTYNIITTADEIVTGITARKNILLIAKEAMNNIGKYSKATAAALSLHTAQKELVLIITDDGVGFNAAATNAGNGLDNMKQRTKELNGIFTITATEGKGTQIKAVFPLQHIN
jgi:signal transduction histidine kinase